MEITLEDVRRILNKGTLRISDTVTMKQAAQVLGLHPNTLHAQRAAGNLKTVKEEGRRFVEVREVIRYAEESVGKHGRKK